MCDGCIRIPWGKKPNIPRDHNSIDFSVCVYVFVCVLYCLRIMRRHARSSDKQIDAYIHQLIVEKAVQIPDDSLGAYVASILRVKDDDVRESLVELLREHCDLDQETAETLLEEITNIVTTGQVPVPTGVASISRPTPYEHRPPPQGSHDFSYSNNGNPTNTVRESLSPMDEATFPPLGEEPVQPQNPTGATAVAAAAPHNESTTYSTHYHDNYSNNNQQQQQELENRTEEDVIGEWTQAVEVLVAYNPNVTHDTCTAALSLVNVHVPAAHQLIQQALQAPPVCRHLLQDGCYRKDCQFSHDVEHHTCLFWMRGACNQGPNCRFLHGFSPRNAEDLLRLWDAPSSEPPGLEEQEATSTQSLPQVAKPSPSSFANIASQGLSRQSFQQTSSSSSLAAASTGSLSQRIPTVRIPLELWHAHENRDASAFHITDPMERYHAVAETVRRADIVDLHFQSLKTVDVVLANVLPSKLSTMSEVWIVTGTGHHVVKGSHQKKGATLEQAVLEWLLDNGYNVARGKDKNGQGGALLVRQ